MRIVILPYKISSIAAKAIANYFNGLRIFSNKNYRYKNNDLIINYGYCNEVPVFNGIPENTILNKPLYCRNASDKISTLKILHENNISCVDFYLTKNDALQQIELGNIIYCRTITRGKEGNGIILAKNAEELVDAPLYTKYFKNNKEFRIHVFNNLVIDIVQKRRITKENAEERGIILNEDSKFIRNHHRGYNFCRENIEVNDKILNLAINATRALNLNFAAVDIVYDSKTNECKVLELNTAPGMEEGTITHAKYCEAISEYCNMEFDIEEYNNRYNINIVL